MSSRKKAAGLDSSLKGAVDSAQQLLTAGLGAITKAQEESNRVIENLVKEGQEIQERTVKFANQKVVEVTGEVTDKVSKLAGSVSSKATQHWDKLEQVFEERVARALAVWVSQPTKTCNNCLNASTNCLPPSPN